MRESISSSIGLHLLADLTGVQVDKLNNLGFIEGVLLDAAHAAEATILHSHFHAFGEGEGVTGLVLLAESHISIHTWPEYKFAAVDIFMCGDSKPRKALEVIERGFNAESVTMHKIARG
jgi:S-adenosylmethionine decarboxylase